MLSSTDFKQLYYERTILQGKWFSLSQSFTYFLLWYIVYVGPDTDYELFPWIQKQNGYIRIADSLTELVYLWAIPWFTIEYYRPNSEDVYECSESETEKITKDMLVLTFQYWELAKRLENLWDLQVCFKVNFDEKMALKSLENGYNTWVKDERTRTKDDLEIRSSKWQISEMENLLLAKYEEFRKRAFPWTADNYVFTADIIPLFYHFQRSGQILVSLPKFIENGMEHLTKIPSNYVITIQHLVDDTKKFHFLTDSERLRWWDEYIPLSKLETQFTDVFFDNLKEVTQGISYDEIVFAMEWIEYEDNPARKKQFRKMIDNTKTTINKKIFSATGIENFFITKDSHLYLWRPDVVENI